MDALRARFGALVEWVAAAACVAGVVAMGSSVFRDVRAAATVTSVSARDAADVVPPAGIPPRAVSVPMLLVSGDSLGDRTVSLGDTASAVAERLGPRAESSRPAGERGPHGERLTRFYDVGGTRFAVVFESPNPGSTPQVSAIFVP